MRHVARTVVWISVATLSAAVIGTAVLNAVDVREIARTDPRRAAHYRPPWFNVSETYTDGVVLGITVGSSKAAAIKAAEAAGFVVSPGSWGDNRAGGAELYARPILVATMLRQSSLNFEDPRNSKQGMTVYFRGDRVASVSVDYINSETL